MKWMFAPMYRPPCYGSVPSGFFLIERGDLIDAAPARVDLPAGNRPYGVIAYNRELTPAEVDDFQLLPLGQEAPR